MNIGFDLDKVFIDYPPFVSPSFIDKLYKKKDNGVLIYRIPKYPEQLLRNVSHIPILRPAIKDNLEFLRSISKKDNKLYLISSRFKFLEKRTEKLIKRYQLDQIFDEMFFNFENIQPHVFKNQVIKKLNLDVYVDDDLSLIKHVARENKLTNFYWLNQIKQDAPLANNIFAVSKITKIFEK